MANLNNDHYKCWNCEKLDCNVGKFKEPPKDQQKIDNNKRVYQDKIKSGKIKPKNGHRRLMIRDKERRVTETSNIAGRCGIRATWQ